MTIADRERWEAKYADRLPPTELQPYEWLVRHASGLKPGKALDLACGHGQTAIWLVERGWDVTAMDISPTGLAAAQKFSESRNVRVNWVAADLDEAPLGVAAYDLITVFRFLDRQTLPARIAAALRPGGWLLYETFLAAESELGGHHVKNPAFTLRSGELPKLYSGLKVVEYSESFTGGESVARLAASKL